MSDTTASPGKDLKKLVTLAVLHMAQYFPAAFTGTFLPFIFRKEGLPLEMFWLLALPGMPRWLKWAMALVVDHFGSRRIGHRKSWIIPCTAVGTLAYALLALIPPSLTAVHLIVGILLFKSFVMAAQDIAVDAYAAESMTDAERPVGTALINFLGAVAGVLGSGAIILVDLFGWATTMLAASAVMMLAAMPAILRPEPPPPEASRQRQARGERPNLWRALRRRDSWYIMPFMYMLGAGGSFLGAMIGPFWADKGLSTTEFGILAPISGLAGGAFAALTTPWLIGRIGMRRTAMIGVAVLPVEAALYCTFWLVPTLPALPVLIVSVALFAWLTAVYGYTASISRFRWASKAQAGTDYALQSSVWNLGVSSGAAVSGFAAALLGWTFFFPLAALVTMVGGVFYIVFWDRIEAIVAAREREETAGQAPPDETVSPG